MTYTSKQKERNIKRNTKTSRGDCYVKFKNPDWSSHIKAQYSCVKDIMERYKYKRLECKWASCPLQVPLVASSLSPLVNS